MKPQKRYSFHPVLLSELNILPVHWWFKRKLEDLNTRPYYRIRQVGKIWPAPVYTDRGWIALASRNGEQPATTVD